MGYIGNQTSNSYSSMDKQTITGNGGTSYTLTHAVANAQEIEVFVNNVRQEAGVAYTVSGTALTMTGNVASTDDFYVIYQGKALQTTVPPDDSVTTARINDGAVTNAKIDTMAATKLTGTISNLRFPSGSIIQTQYTQFTGTSLVSIAASTDTPITDLTVNITPVSTSSIIRIEAMVSGEWTNQAAGGTNGVWFFYRDSTKLAAPSAGNRDTGVMIGTSIGYDIADATSTPEQAHYSYFDTPSTTSQITYKVGVREYSGSDWHLNRTVNDTDSAGHERGTSFICVTEIAG